MARIVFVQNIFREYPAYMALAADLKKYGHYAGVVIARGEKDVVSAIMAHSPNLVGFSPTAYDIEWCLGMARVLKNAGLDIIMGGAMVTADQDVIHNLAVDFVCVGEGELCMRQLLRLEDRKDISDKYDSIPNLVYKKDGQVFHNPVAPMINDIDGLSIPDHGLYGQYDKIVKGPTAIFTFMRGCRFNCSFCFNHVWQKIYRNKPFIIRKRSPELAVREIEETIETRKGAIKLVRLFDSTLLSDTHWVKSFLSLYKERIKVPFVCFAHPSEVNDEMSKELKDSLCIEVAFSIESGTDFIRNKILRKGISESQIYMAAKALKKNHVPFVTFNMLGSPGESWKDILKTIEINRNVKPMFAWAALTQVYLGTDLEGITRRSEPTKVIPWQEYGVLDYRHQNQAQILPLIGAFPFIIRYPKLSRIILGKYITLNGLTLRLMSFISFFMQCVRPALSFKEFISHYIFEEGQGLGYY